jgi:hypothetical protein
MSKVYGTRELLRNPSLLRISPDENIIIEDKKAHKRLGVYIGTALADKFFRYLEKEKLLESAKKIKNSSKDEYQKLEGTLLDGL